MKNSYGGDIAWIESGSEWTDISGYYGAEGNEDSIEWRLTQDGELKISGKGQMSTSNIIGNSPWCKYRALIRTVTIDDGIENIGANAFRLCNNISAISIPDSVLDIGIFAFSECSSLKHIIIPDSVKKHFGICI